MYIQENEQKKQNFVEGSDQSTHTFQLERHCLQT